MGPDSPVVKYGIILVFVAVVAHFVLRYKNDQEAQVQLTVTTIRSIATELGKEEGTSVDFITTAISPLHNVSIGNLEKGIMQTGTTKQDYVAAELVLLRVYEIDKGAIISTHIKLDGSGPNWPWVFEGESARLDPFQIDSGKEVGSMKDLLTMYRQQGMPRAPWRE